jgi:integrase
LAVVVQTKGWQRLPFDASPSVLVEVAHLLVFRHGLDFGGANEANRSSLRSVMVPSSMSLAIASGADVKVVQRMLGHKSATLPLDLYGHLFPDRLDVVADAMDAAAQHRSEVCQISVTKVRS